MEEKNEGRSNGRKKEMKEGAMEEKRNVANKERKEQCMKKNERMEGRSNEAFSIKNPKFCWFLLRVYFLFMIVK